MFLSISLFREKEIYSKGRFSDFCSFIFHCIFIIFFVSFIRYDSPFLWKAFHKNGYDNKLIM